MSAVDSAGRDLVTGASGFIGQALCRALRAHQREVLALNRRAVAGPWDAAHLVDLEHDDLGDFTPGPIDTVYHLAARVHQAGESAPQASAHQSMNVEGTEKLLRWCLAHGVRRFVYFSTIKAMGEFTTHCEDEGTAPRPVSAYGRSKREAECLVLRAGEGAPLEVVVLRLAVVYGAGSKGNVTQMLRLVMRGWFPPLPEFGNRRSMVHVDDVVEAARLAAQHPQAVGEIFLLTGGTAHSSRELYEAMCRSAGRSLPRWRVSPWILRAGAWLGDLGGALLRRRLPFDSSSYATLAGSAQYCGGRLRERLGFEPSRRLEDGLDEMVRWLRQASR